MHEMWLTGGDGGESAALINGSCMRWWSRFTLRESAVQHVSFPPTTKRKLHPRLKLAETTRNKLVLLFIRPTCIKFSRGQERVECELLHFFILYLGNHVFVLHWALCCPSRASTCYLLICNYAKVFFLQAGQSQSLTCRIQLTNKSGTGRAIRTKERYTNDDERWMKNKPWETGT